MTPLHRQSEQEPPLLEVRRLSHRYGALEVTRELSLHLAKGSIGCLLGPSGCGKTTVLRCIAGFESPSDGEIFLAGTLVSSRHKLLPAEKRRIGVVFQDYALFPHRTVTGNIAFGLRGLDRAQRQRRVDELLEIVGLPELRSKYPHELSGGQQQRVALARALAPRPDLLLLDEPFSNLDIDLRERLTAEVRDILKQQNATAILVTHDQHEAFALADEIGIMHDGRIEQWDTPYNLYHRPSTRFVANFIGQGAFLPGVVSGPSHIKCELGTLPASIPEAWPHGSAVDVLLRPDDITHDDSSALKAAVTAKSFRGAQFLYTLRLPGGGRALSLVPSHHNHALGEEIGIRLELDHVIAFPRAG